MPSVLVVDDDEGMVETLTDILTASGYAVDSATSAVEALARLEQRRYDLVLMDIVMASLDGVEARRRMNARVPDMPVVLMTAFSNEELFREAEAEGAIVFRKPFDIAMALDVLRRLTRSE